MVRGKLFFLILWLTTTMFADCLQAQTLHRVLLISSYSQGNVGFVQQMEGIRSVFADEPIVVDVEFMDRKRFADPQGLVLFSRLLAYKLKHMAAYDLVLAADDDAFTFVVEERDELFADLPVVFFGVNDVDLAMAQDREPGITGVVETLSMEETLILMRTLHPGAREYVALANETTSGKLNAAAFFNAAAALGMKNVSLISMAQNSSAEFASALRQLDQGSPVLELSVFNSNAHTPLRYEEGLASIKADLKSPFYSLWTFGLGKGILGGKMVSHFTQGEAAARIALDILKGKAIREISVRDDLPNRFHFDYQELVRYGIKLKDLPPGSELINGPSEGSAVNKNLLYGLGGGGILLLSIGLLWLWRKNRRAQQALQSSETRCLEEKRQFFHTFEQMAVGITHAGMDGRFLRVNQKFCNIVGYAREELLQLTFNDIVYPEDLTVDQELVRRLLGDEIKTYTIEKRYLRKDGTIVWVDLTVSLVRDSAENAPFYISAIKDISQRVRMLTVLKSSEKKFHDLFNNIPDAIVMGDRHRRIVDVNPAFVKLFDYTLAEIKDRQAQLLYADEKEFYNVGRLLNQNFRDDPFVRTVQFRKKNGELFSGEINAHFMKDEQGNVSGFIGLIRDITERLHWEVKLKESESRYRAIFENDHTVMLLINPERREIVDANPAALAFYQYPREKIIGMKVAEINGSAPEIISQKSEAALDVSVTSFEDRHRLATGEVRDVYIYRGPIEINKKQCLFSIVHDVSERKIMERNLIRAQKKAVRANRAKSTFLANMSHEIRTPMNIILGFLDLLLNDLSLSELQRKYLATAQDSASSLLKLINDILDYSKLESSRMIIEKQPFKLSKLTTRIQETLAMKAREKGLSLHFDIFPSLPDGYLGDPLRLRQIIINLLDNAIKFTEKGRVTLRIRPGEGEGQLSFAVEDTGIGIPVDRLNEIFKPFIQADPSTTRKFGGTGLGMTISRELIMLMGGRLWVESEEGMGSTFHFTINLPVADQIAEAGEHSSGSGRSSLPGDRRRFRILLVEDVEANVELAKIRLGRQGHTIKVAWNGHEAVELFRRGRVDVILMDIHMSRMNGLEATKQIRALELKSAGHVPIIAMTASVMKDEMDKYLASGVDCIVAKPIDFDHLFRLLEKVVPTGVGQPLQVAGRPLGETSQPDLPLLDGVDVQQGLATWKEWPAYRKALSGFSANYGDSAERIIHCLEMGETAEAYRLAHTLKGVAGNLSLPDLYSVVAEIAARLKSERLEGVQELLDSLANGLIRVSRSLRTIEYQQNRGGGQFKKELNGKYLAALFDNMLQAFEQFNPKAVQPFLEELNQYLFSPQLQSIEHHLGNFDFASARRDVLSLAATLNIEGKEFQAEETTDSR